MYRQVALAVLCTVLFAGADWTRFRGPEGSGVVDDTGLPTTWSAGENVVWKTALPGFGSSSPITLGDRIFLTTAIAIGKATIKYPNEGAQLPNPAMFGGMSHASLLATTSFGHVLGMGAILGLAARGVI